MWNIINDDPIIGWHRKEETMTSDISVKAKTDFKGTIHISGSHTYCTDLSVDSGTHSSFHENCHRQIIYRKFDLKIFYPLLYERTISHCKYTNTYLIKKTINNFDWKRAFEGWPKYEG